MTDRKIIAVVGATGAQGGGLARAILEDAGGGFAVRAVTRDPRSERAQALAALGAEVVQADLDDLKTVAKAFRGAYGAYCVTNFWEHGSPERELAQARNLAKAAGAMGTEHVIWSTLEDTRLRVPLADDHLPTLMGRYKVPHFDAKGEADGAFLDAEVPVTFLLTSFYWDNLIHFGMGPRPGPDGQLALTLPMGDRRLPGIAAEDIGRCAYGIFRQGAPYLGRTVGIAGGHLTGAQMAEALARALGHPVHYRPMEPEAYRRLGFPGAADLGNMFQFNQDFEGEFCGARDLEESRALNPRLQSFEQWVTANRGRIPVEVGAHP
jgi:uncharacterized protein YbjT (DUF2867 family)